MGPSCVFFDLCTRCVNNIVMHWLGFKTFVSTLVVDNIVLVIPLVVVSTIVAQFVNRFLVYIIWGLSLQSAGRGLIVCTENWLASACIVFPVQLLVAPNFGYIRRRTMDAGIPGFFWDFIVISAITSIWNPFWFKQMQRLFIGDVSIHWQRCHNSFYRVEDKQIWGEETWFNWRWRYYNWYKFFLARIFVYKADGIFFWLSNFKVRTRSQNNIYEITTATLERGVWNQKYYLYWKTPALSRRPLLLSNTPIHCSGNLA